MKAPVMCSPRNNDGGFGGWGGRGGENLLSGPPISWNNASFTDN